MGESLEFSDLEEDSSTDDDSWASDKNAIFSQYFRTFELNLATCASCCRHDQSAQVQQNEQLYKAWQAQIPALVHAYLQWKHNSVHIIIEDDQCHTFYVGSVGFKGIVQAMAKVFYALHNLPEDHNFQLKCIHTIDGNFSARRMGSSGQGNHSYNCTENWMAAKSTDEGKVQVFDQTGIFVMAYRHGFVETVAKMKCSGELEKYSLATISKLSDVCGASQVRIWKRFLDLHFDQWNKDKYLELSWFLFNNYKQALTIINDNNADLQAYQKLQCIDELDKLKFAEAKYGSLTASPFLSHTPAHFTSSSGLSQSALIDTRAVESERKEAHQKLLLQMNLVHDFVLRAGIKEEWNESHPEYIKACEYIAVWHFCLFKLSKANLSGTGYKMRKKLSKAIAKWSGTI
ncbi:hypothetical protein SERLADRAFT_404524 [Serpula lacrymans var. lacrymans S7.9]|uniref:Uncharacterized protein n=1 Tax=Serpula lacrymans var. lacrymans (strain S7.9) TaxID=578457 RepID=F8NDD9_SERL9|nr:uncharacterized protein SERLADRAFT_404524 [Serpula lacrymans var. lacrymans S7.9]EGO30277.1 hypothetical protein SERLADRAFT_404524 [Serpula lacrymans var. lacrymans S7.9]